MRLDLAIIGGTCLNRGCILAKYLSHATRKYLGAKNTDDGILFQNIKIDYSKIRLKMESIISSLRVGLSENLKKIWLNI